MNVNITALNFEISERLTEFINKKAARLAHKDPDITDYDARLKVVKPETALNKQATLMVVVPDSPDLVATKVCDTFEEAVDQAISALERQLEKLKDRK